jgi:biotin synthase
MQKIFLCAISNIASGSCNEDCAFCAQSARYNADISRYKSKPVAEIVDEARKAAAAGAVGFCLVTAGRGVTDLILEYVCEAARAVKKADLGVKIIACNGDATREQLAEIKKAGADLYNHNLETSERFFPRICATHLWTDRVRTNENALSAGLALVLGGIIGLGETNEDREDLFKAIAKFKPMSAPLNFYIKNPALPIDLEPLGIDEALFWVKRMREILGEAPRIMLAGGKEQVFGDRLMDAIAAGANAMVVGNYLTTLGMDSGDLRDMIFRAGHGVAAPEDCAMMFAAN